MVKKLLLFFLPIILFYNVNAEELEYMNITKTSMHVYTNTLNIGTGTCTVLVDSPIYTQITASQGSSTFTPPSSSPLIISKIAYNIFGNFQHNKTYKILWETDFPNDLDLDQFACSIGSYTNNTAYPPYSNSPCTIERSDNGNVIMSGYVTIEQGQYVSVVITPKVGVDTNHVYCFDDLPKLITKPFILSYGNPRALLVKSEIGAIDNQTNAINNQTNAINNQTNTINNQTNVINDDSLPNTSNFLDDWTDLLLENNTINQILYLPVNVLTNIKSAFNGTCNNYTMPFGLTGGNETLTFTCWTISDYLGSEITGLISGFIGFYMIYYFALFLWKFYDDFTSMKDTLSIILENPDGPLQKGEIE